MNKKTDNREFYQKLIKLTLPITLQQLMLASVAVADAMMLGSVEQNAMSAVSLASQIQFVQNMVMAAAVSAASVLGAQYWGKGDKKTLNDVFCICLRLCGVLSLVTFIGCVFFPRALMTIFTNEEVLIEIGIKYLEIAGWSYLITGVTQCYLTLMKVSEHAAESAKISTGTVILNILLNVVFIYGLFGLPAMGVLGAALATLISRILELIWVVLASGKDGFIKPDLSRILIRDKALCADYWKCVLPLIGACLIWGVGFTSYTAFMGHLGTDAAAGNSVTAVVRDMVCCACDGLAGGGGILIGNELGAGNLEQGKRYGKKILFLSYVIGIMSTIIMLALTPILLSFVKLTPQARELFLGMMVIMAFYMIGRAVNTIVINGVFTAGGDTLFDLYSLIVTMWCIAIPLAAAGTFWLHWSPLVVYACTCLDEVGKIPWVMLHFRKYKWVKDLTREV